MGSHDIPFISFDQFGGSLYEKAVSRRIPLGGSLEITFRCNLFCVHCYCNLPPNNHRALKDEITTGEIFSILDQLAEAGCLWLLITGGEPLIRNDFLDIYTYAKKKGFLISLFTNGTLLTPEIADHLAAWPPYEVEISLYGFSRETYERITGNHGSFQRCRQGIELLLERKIPLDLKTPVMTLNKDEILQIKALAEQLGLKFRFDPALTPKLDGGKAPCQFRLSPQEVIALDRADDKREMEWRNEFKKPAVQIDPDKLYLCGAGLTSFHIDPYGKMSICDMCRFHHYDLRSGSFREGWEGNIPLLLNTKRETDSPCHTCPWTDQCDNCPGWSWMENGNLEEPVDYFCTITRLRAKAFG
jgi:radical SAM protein with 4Fe4S-binding SPASM domain